MSEAAAAAVLKLPDVFDISTVGDMKSGFTVALGAGEGVRVDGSSVQRVDAAALQLLFVLRREAERRGLEVTWTGASKVLRRAASATAMSGPLGLEDEPQDRPR